jgi:EmrB/QacA subfamily drug resistance transporter
MTRHPASPTPSAAASARLRPAVQYALLAGPLLSMLDSSIVNVAVEPIGWQLHASLPLVQWTVSGYLLTLGTGLSATACLSRRVGTIRLYHLSVLAFTVASAACAAAPDIQSLLVMRLAQGLVAAPLVPMAMTMLFGQGQSARDMPATAGMLLFLGPALGPSVGGALIGVLGWRSIFLINVPAGLAAVLAIRRVPATLGTPPAAGGAQLDRPGLLLLGSGLASVLLGISQSGEGWAGLSCWLPVLAGVTLLAGYVAWSGRAEQPALDLSLAHGRESVLALTLCATASVVTFAVVFLLPVFVQSAQGHSALATGLAMLPQGIITGLSTTLGRRALRLISLRTTVLSGFALLTTASAGLLLVSSRTPLTATAALLAVRSVSIGLVISPLLAVLTGKLSAARLADGSTLFSIWQRIAGSLGVGLIASTFAAQAVRHGPVAALHVTGALVTAISAAGLLAALLLPAGVPLQPPAANRPGRAWPRRLRVRALSSPQPLATNQLP